MAPIAQADRACGPLLSQITIAKDEFADWEPSLGASAFPDADECKVVQTTSGPVLWCTWSFAYRDDAASTRFESLRSEVASCMGPDTARRTDPAVNHPDSYNLHEFDTDDVVVAVSIKDKGALQKTLVFFRIHPKPD